LKLTLTRHSYIYFLKTTTFLDILDIGYYFLIKESKLGPRLSGCFIIGGNSIGDWVSGLSRSTTLWIDIHPHLILSHLDLYKYWASVSMHAMADDTKNERKTSVNIIIINWFNLYNYIMQF